MKNLVTVGFLLLALVGCVEVQDEKKETQTEDTHVEVSKLSYQIEALAQVQSYLVKFSGIDCDKKITKMTRSKSDQIVQLSQCSEVVNEPGLHVYKFDEGMLQVEIPQDVVIRGHMRLSDLNPKKVEQKARYTQHLKIAGRLYFESASIISTNGESVLIEAQSISSDGGRIVTFFDNVTASDGQNGKHGGLIHLVSPRIQGAIEVILQGQNGGNGESEVALNGKRLENLIINGGNGGNSGQFWLETTDDSMSQIKIIKIPGNRGIGSEIRGGCGLFSGDNCHPRILRPKGTDGHLGLEEKSCMIKNNQCTNFILN